MDSDTLAGQEIFGQGEAVSRLRALAVHPVHAFLFSGPPGVGKEEAAIGFAKCLICENGGCGTCWHCVAVAEGRHPDVVVLQRSGAAISVDQAREVSSLALRSPSVARRLVVVLPDFHLVDEAAPALLKSIEEPPSTTVFIILADQVTPRLVTVASRCVEVPFRSLPESRIVDVLIGEGVGDDQARTAAALSGGRLDRARKALSDATIVERHKLWSEIPARLDGRGSTSAVIADELEGSIDSALVDLKESQEAEIKQADELSKAGRDAPLRSELILRHRREQRQARTFELRFGFGALERAYKDLFVSASVAVPHRDAAPLAEAVRLIEGASRALERNPSEPLLLQALLVRLSALA